MLAHQRDTRDARFGRRTIVAGMLALVVMLATVALAEAVSIGFTSTGTSAIRFDGSTDSFVFVNPPPATSDTDHTGTTRDFVITLDGPFSTLTGLLGNITGTFTIGPISTNGNVQTAPVSGAGKFSINDGAGQSFLADLTWQDIQTINAGGFVSFGAVNPLAKLNLTNLSYTGANADLLSLASYAGAVVAAGFVFSPSSNLAALTANGQVHSTSYVGTLTPVPEPITMFLGGTGLITLGWVARRRLFGK